MVESRIETEEKRNINQKQKKARKKQITNGKVGFEFYINAIALFWPLLRLLDARMLGCHLSLANPYGLSTRNE